MRYALARVAPSGERLVSRFGGWVPRAREALCRFGCACVVVGHCLGHLG